VTPPRPHNSNQPRIMTTISPTTPSSLVPPTTAATTTGKSPPIIMEPRLLDPQQRLLYMPPSILPPEQNLPANSTRRLTRLDVQRAINDVKRFVEGRLESDLRLVKVRRVPATALPPRARCTSATSSLKSAFGHILCSRTLCLSFLGFGST
jgi:hypothetical protein